MVKRFFSSNGIELTDELVEELAAEAEQGFPNSILTHEPAPWGETAAMETHSLRVSRTLWKLIERKAAANGMSTSEYVRQVLLSAVLKNPHATQRQHRPDEGRETA